jgi:pyruvate formate lyase activating enzyme
MKEIKVALRKTSLVDYPGKVASVLFFCGCNLRCPWCYNWELVLSPPEDTTPLNEALALVKKRRHLLGGVVLSGGEPTLVKELPEIIANIKALGLPVKLDTNGMLPDTLKRLCETETTRPDFIAMDIKLPPERYIELTGGDDETPDKARKTADNILKSVSFIRDSGIDHEFRSLLLPPSYFSANDLDIIKRIADKTLKVRAFRSGNCLDKTWDHYNSTHNLYRSRTGGGSRGIASQFRPLAPTAYGVLRYPLCGGQPPQRPRLAWSFAKQNSLAQCEALSHPLS